LGAQIGPYQRKPGRGRFASYPADHGQMRPHTAAGVQCTCNPRAAAIRGDGPGLPGLAAGRSPPGRTGTQRRSPLVPTASARPTRPPWQVDSPGKPRAHCGVAEVVGPGGERRCLRFGRQRHQDPAPTSGNAVGVGFVLPGQMPRRRIAVQRGHIRGT
jgi:hypothetical protein